MSAFDADQLKKMFQVTVTDEADGRKRMGGGKASAMVVIPKGFTLDLLEAKPVTLLVVKNPAEQFLPDVVEEFMNTMAVMLSGVVQAFAEEVKGIRALLDLKLDGFPWESLAPEFGKAQKKVIAAAKYLDPLLIRLKTEETKAAGAKNELHPGGPLLDHPPRHGGHVPAVHRPDPDAGYHLRARGRQAPAHDDHARSGRSSSSAPASFGGWVMGLVVLLVMVAAGTLVFRVHWGPFGYFLILGAVASFWTAAFFALLHALVRNRNQAGALSAPIILAFSLFGGSMMNPEVMPKAFLTVGLLTPNRWFIDGAALVRDGRFPSAGLLVLFASGLVLLALAVPALRRRTSV